MRIYELPNDKTSKLLQQRNVNTISVSESVNEIIDLVKTDGDVALKALNKKYDNVDIDELRVSRMEIENAKSNMDEALVEAINIAANNIKTFHQSQLPQTNKISTMPGVMCWQEYRPIERIGIYIPGGSAPLFSTVLMLGIPAQLAGCKEIILVSPASSNGKIADAILYTADLIGIEKIYKVGGAQAIAALSFGTDSIPAVHKILGPGNAYVTEAKKQVQQLGTAIDMPAGPSELLIIATNGSIAEYIAADLLSQAEHGPDSQVILLCTNTRLAQEVVSQIKDQIEFLPRKEIALQALSQSAIIVLPTLQDCVQWSNEYAPEHLIISGDTYDEILPKINSAGSIFLGNYSCESIGDYASGTNHTLPTYGYASTYSGVSIDSFIKKITVQKISEEGIRNIGPSVEIMAKAELLEAHAKSVSLRLKNIER